MRYLLPLILFTLTACEAFPPASELGEDNQVMAIRATPPEVHPGGTVVLDALVHWPTGTGTGTLSWILCVPGVGDNLVTCLPNQLPPGDLPPLCSVDPEARVCVAGVADTVIYTVPLDAFPDDGQQHTVFVYLLASTSVDGFTDCQDTLMGGAPTFDCLLSIKRVVVSTRDPANQNPVATGLIVAGETVEASVVAEVHVDAADLEKFQVSLGLTLDATSIDEVLPSASPDNDPAQLTVQWFTDCGEIADPILYLDVGADGNDGLLYETELTRWKPKQTGPCLVHAVVRDENGGAGFLTQHLQVIAP